MRAVLALALLSLLAAVPSAHAGYLDPGAGSYMLQLLIASLVGALYTLKLYYHRIRAYLRGPRGRDKSAAQGR
jgi:hypothetical protein